MGAVDPRWVIAELRRVCRELDAGLPPIRPRVGRALRLAAIPVALGLGGGLSCPEQEASAPPSEVSAPAEPAAPGSDASSPSAAAAAPSPREAGVDADAPVITHGGGAGSGVGLYGAPFDRRGGSRDRLLLPPPQVEGVLPREVVRRIVRRHAQSLRYCYQQAFCDRAALEEEVVLRLTISARGAVDGVELLRSTPRSEPVASCLEAAFRRMQFPPDDAGRATTAEVVVGYRRPPP